MEVWNKNRKNHWNLLSLPYKRKCYKRFRVSCATRRTHGLRKGSFCYMLGLKQPKMLAKLLKLMNSHVNDEDYNGESKFQGIKKGIQWGENFNISPSSKESAPQSEMIEGEFIHSTVELISKDNIRQEKSQEYIHPSPTITAFQWPSL